MPYDPFRHHRRSIRLKGYDYSQAGAYFITICTQNRACLLDVPVVDAMIAHWWQELANKYPSVSLDAFVVMPNHLHGILLLFDPDPPAPNPQLGTVVQWFKSMTTNAYIRGVKESGWEPFSGRLWQRNYYERIIRNERELTATRLYIEANPDNWTADENHPGLLRG